MYAEGFAYTLDHILQQVSWYWLTKSYGRGLWAYRGAWAAILRDDPRKLPSPLKITNKPLGYSFYPQEVIGAAKSWLEHWFPENLVLFRAHKQVSTRRIVSVVVFSGDADENVGRAFCCCR